jgi:toxin ParE1/3/4
MSVRKRRLILAPKAQDDLRNILVYTERQWGKSQRRSYRQRLVEAFSELASYAEIGLARPEFGPNIRSYRVGQHVIIYQASEAELRIARMLHVRQDIDATIS